MQANGDSLFVGISVVDSHPGRVQDETIRARIGPVFTRGKHVVLPKIFEDRFIIESDF